MASNIRVKKICENCSKEFEARKTTTKTCSDACAKKLYKNKKRDEKIESVTINTTLMKYNEMEEVKAKEFLTVADLAKLLNCSRRTAYNFIQRGDIKSVNIAKRKTLIKRSEVDKLFQ